MTKKFSLSLKKALITGVTGQDGSYLVELLLEPGIKLVSRVPKLDCRSGAIDLVEGGTAAALPTPGSPDALSSAAFACLRAHIDCRGADGPDLPERADEGFDPGFEPASNELL